MRPEEIVDATFTRAGRLIRLNFNGRFSHEEWRAMIRDTYPTSLSKVGPTWVERYGREIDWTATEAWGEAHREDWARRTVAAAGKDWRTHLAKFSGAVLPRAQVDQKARRRAHLGRGVCSGWADEDDYGPRYS